MFQSKKTISLIGTLLCAVVLYLFQAHGIFYSQSSVVSRVLNNQVASNGAFTLVTEPDEGTKPVISLIDSATKSVDLVMYSLNDTAVEQSLVDAKDKGIAVRVLLDAGYQGKPSSANTVSYQYLSSHGVNVKWTPSYFTLTHQKTLIVDDVKALIMTFNLDAKYYTNDRDFGVLDVDIADVQAIENTFDADWRGQKIALQNGDDLVWSPGSENELISLIESAQKSILVYNEEMKDSKISAALEAAAKRGVTVQVIMTMSSEWMEAFQELWGTGVHIGTYANTKKAAYYIHAKMILVDKKVVFLGSENFSQASLLSNRELGIILSEPQIVSALASLFGSDWTGATPFGGR